LSLIPCHFPLATFHYHSHLPIIKSQPVKSFHEKTHSSSFEESFELREFSAILSHTQRYRKKERERESERERRELLFYFGFSFADATWLTCHNWRTNPGSLMPHKYEYNSRMPRTCHKRVASTSGKVNAGILFAVDIATLFNYEINIMPTKPLKGATVASLTLPIPYLTPLLPYPLSPLLAPLAVQLTCHSCRLSLSRVSPRACVNHNGQLFPHRRTSFTFLLFCWILLFPFPTFPSLQRDTPNA